jgi:CheY-like chemotaxis protein
LACTPAHTQQEEPIMNQVRIEDDHPARLRHILLAEDDDDQRAGLRDFFELSGYSVSSVASGTELLEAVAEMNGGTQERPDLIITDIHMPGVPGLNVAEELRAEGWLEPIIVISGIHPNTVVADRLDELENVRFVPKPFDPEALADIVYELTAR